MDKNLHQILGDRFEGWELVEYLQIPVDRIIEAFGEEIDEAADDLEEFCGLRQDEDDGEL